MFSERVKWLIYFCLGLFFLYRFLIADDLIFKYLFLVVGVLDLCMVMTRVGLYNYHNKSYPWLDYD